MEQRSWIITGASSGLGRALTEAALAAGDTVVAAMRRPERIDDLLDAYPRTILPVAFDVRGTAEASGLIGAAIDRFGPVDVLVNNAGYNENAPMLTMKLDTYDAVADLARGTWYLTKLLLRRFMLRSEGGSIINITSVVGATGNPGQIPYTMVKAGLDAFTKSLAQELAGRPIRVNSVAPGFIETEMTEELPEEIREAILARVPQGRMGTPEEVADVVAFLATRGSYVNGTVLHVNGGLYGG